MWNVIFGRSVVVGGLAFGVERDEQASVGKRKTIVRLSSYRYYYQSHRTVSVFCTIYFYGKRTRIS